MTDAASGSSVERWSRANASLERRAAPREQVLLPALLILPEGLRRPCIILDRSAGGLRLQLPGGEPAPDSFAVIDLVTGVGRDVEVVWRSPPTLGVRALRSYDLNAPRDGRGQELQRIWNTVLR